MESRRHSAEDGAVIGRNAAAHAARIDGEGALAGLEGKQRVAQGETSIHDRTYLAGERIEPVASGIEAGEGASS
ncbi:MAG: hypothetical protein QGI52_03835, partial [Alphaproteobacteria bacterium]|nr:hypothetical protein [Alphaproteobacteria bacterium]